MRRAMTRLLLTLLFVLSLASSPVMAAEEDASFEAVRAGAEQGDARAQFMLGVMYAAGMGVPVNDAEAIK